MHLIVLLLVVILIAILAPGFLGLGFLCGIDAAISLFKMWPMLLVLAIVVVLLGLIFAWAQIEMASAPREAGGAGSVVENPGAGGSERVRPYRVIGIDRESGYETEFVVDALSESHAKIIGDMRGVTVTSAAIEENASS
jgi:hypothetical protein